MKLNPEIVTRNGKPIKVILDFDKYEELLELVEDKEDFKQFERQKKNRREIPETRRFSKGILASCMRFFCKAGKRRI